MPKELGGPGDYEGHISNFPIWVEKPWFYQYYFPALLGIYLEDTVYILVIKPKDLAELMLHHVITFGLIINGHLVNCGIIPILIFWTNMLSDVSLFVVKSTKELRNDIIARIGLVITLFTYFYLRLFVIARLIYEMAKVDVA